MKSPFGHTNKDRIRHADRRGSVDVLYESGTSVLKRTLSRRGTFRGMHHQPDPKPQTKIIKVVSGRIVDFVMSVNPGKKQLHAIELNGDSGWIRIDSNLAHGLYAPEDAVFEYFCDGGYDGAGEKCYSIRDFLEREVGIGDLIMSPKDMAAPAVPFDEIQFHGIERLEK